MRPSIFVCFLRFAPLHLPALFSFAQIPVLINVWCQRHVCRPCNQFIFPALLFLCTPVLSRSALYSTHQNHIDREGLRLNFGHLVTCYTNERCPPCFDVFASRLSGIRLPFALSLIAFSPTKGEYNEYNCILANIGDEVLKHVSDITWGYVILI